MAKIIKMKDLLKKEKLMEANIDKKVDTKEVVKRMLKNFKGQYAWVGKAWAKELLKKYRKGISQTDFIIDAENLKNNFGGQGIDKIFKGLNEGKLNEGKVNQSKVNQAFTKGVAAIRKISKTLSDDDNYAFIQKLEKWLK